MGKPEKTIKIELQVTVNGYEEMEAIMNKEQKPISPSVIVQLLIFIVLVPFLPLLISRQWDWWEAWVYAIVSILGFVVSRVLASHRHPDLIRERSQHMQQENIQPWDKKLAIWLGVGGLLVVVIAGLDKLFDWPPTFSLALKILALIVILAGYVLSSYAFIENRFFSSTVRLQTDRGQEVVSSGPYRWIRHPGYTGGLLVYISTPILLDSMWAFLPTILVVVSVIVRTSLEDRFLQAELDGYREYAQRVRYRLLPGVW
jgi:protein-S-isoprenylcysteine O-methyltransferase Ste14